MKKYYLQLSKKSIVLRLFFVVLMIIFIVARAYRGSIVNPSIESFESILLNTKIIIILDLLIGVMTGFALFNKGNPLVFGIVTISMIILIFLPFAYTIIPSLENSFNELLNSIELSLVVLGFSIINLLLCIPPKKKKE